MISNRQKGFISANETQTPVDPAEFIAQPGLVYLAHAGINFRVISACYGNGLFVAVGSTAPYVATSPDGINWTAQTAASVAAWRQVSYGAGLFVAITDGGALASRIMTSPDGVTWTSRAQPTVNVVSQSVCYGNGLFVAVAYSSTVALERVLTSTDGITWTTRTVPTGANLIWERVCYGNGLFVAVAATGTGQRVMTSPDGINWTLRNTPADFNWYSVVYGNGLFVAVAQSGAGNRVMTSPDGITWTLRASANDALPWFQVTYGAGLFVACSNGPAGANTMLIQTSPDGITWTLRDALYNGGYVALCYGNGVFLIGDANTVSTSGFRFITSGVMELQSVQTNNKDVGGRTIYGGLQVETNETKLATVGGRIQQFFTSQGNIGNVATDIYSYSIPANMLNANGQSIEAEYYGTFSSNASAEKTLSLEVAGNLMFSKNPASLSTETPWKVKLTITRISNTAVLVGYIYSDTSTDPPIIGYAQAAGLNLTTTATIVKLVGLSDDPGAADNDVMGVLANLYWSPAAV